MKDHKTLTPEIQSRQVLSAPGTGKRTQSFVCHSSFQNCALSKTREGAWNRVPVTSAQKTQASPLAHAAIRAQKKAPSRTPKSQRRQLLATAGRAESSQTFVRHSIVQICTFGKKRKERSDVTVQTVLQKKKEQQQHSHWRFSDDMFWPHPAAASARSPSSETSSPSTVRV